MTLVEEHQRLDDDVRALRAKCEAASEAGEPSNAKMALTFAALENLVDRLAALRARVSAEKARQDEEADEVASKLLATLRADSAAAVQLFRAGDPAAEQDYRAAVEAAAANFYRSIASLGPAQVAVSNKLRALAAESHTAA